MSNERTKHYRKMTPEEVQALLQFRKRGSVIDKQKTYSRKVKHKKKFYE